ncbi:hypothetical protein BV22DRAFT_1108212 [Leucogyrophana mollusca]|uniref:Uncharacterized protein n=1 Tax=Leucogyrophana mollusca TaxID=85980 RepID=A0ACB8B1Q3_9AGAM|nr:hypothetical protein BV22DRAFT_1108212 [Leucogyrophana mollusca]
MIAYAEVTKENGAIIALDQEKAYDKIDHKSAPQLNGYCIPGIQEKQIINLFADDTMIFMNARDRYEDLKQILNDWCQASGAKKDNQPINNNMHIAPDGHPIRSLSAWIGNEIDNAATWEPTLTKVNNSLKRWEQGHPTLKGKHLIIQMIVGGITQYLTKAQGMPENVEQALEKAIREFIWDNAKQPPISLEYLFKEK